MAIVQWITVALAAGLVGSASGQIVNPGGGGAAGAPATNPTGGANNYAPIANPTFTGTATSPQYTVSDPTAGANPAAITMATPQNGVTEEVHQASGGNQFRVGYYCPNGSFCGIDFGTSYASKGSLVYSNGYDYLFADGFQVFKAPANGAFIQFTPPVFTPLVVETENAAIASAATIAPTTALFHITGTTAISTMTPPSPMSTSVTAGGVGGSLSFVTDSAVTFNAGTGVGQFKSGFTSTAGTVYTCLYTPSTALWYCK